MSTMLYNKLKIVHHLDCKQYADIAYCGLFYQNKVGKINRSCVCHELSENIYFIGVSVDGLHTSSVLRKHQILFRATLKWVWSRLKNWSTSR